MDQAKVNALIVEDSLESVADGLLELRQLLLAIAASSERLQSPQLPQSKH